MERQSLNTFFTVSTFGTKSEFLLSRPTTTKGLHPQTLDHSFVLLVILFDPHDCAWLWCIPGDSHAQDLRACSMSRSKAVRGLAALHSVS